MGDLFTLLFIYNYILTSLHACLAVFEFATNELFASLFQLVLVLLFAGWRSVPPDVVQPLFGLRQNIYGRHIYIKIQQSNLANKPLNFTITFN